MLMPSTKERYLGLFFTLIACLWPLQAAKKLFLRMMYKNIFIWGGVCFFKSPGSENVDPGHSIILETNIKDEIEDHTIIEPSPMLRQVSRSIDGQRVSSREDMLFGHVGLYVIRIYDKSNF